MQASSASTSTPTLLIGAAAGAVALAVAILAAAGNSRTVSIGVLFVLPERVPSGWLKINILLSGHGMIISFSEGWQLHDSVDTYFYCFTKIAVCCKPDVHRRGARSVPDIRGCKAGTCMHPASRVAHASGHLVCQQLGVPVLRPRSGHGAGQTTFGSRFSTNGLSGPALDSTAIQLFRTYLCLAEVHQPMQTCL